MNKLLFSKKVAESFEAFQKGPQQEVAIEQCILFTPVGSHLYGTNNENSDHDYVGIFMPTKRQLFGFQKEDVVHLRTNPSDSGRLATKDDFEVTFYSVPKFIQLASNGNPNIIEILFSPYATGTDEGSLLLKNRDAFLSKRIRSTFGGFAQSQLVKMGGKVDRLNAIKRQMLDIAVGKWDQYIIEGTDRVPRLSRRMALCGEHATYRQHEKGTPIADVVHWLEEAHTQYGKRTQNIVENAYDTKFAAHLIRILREWITLATEGKLTFPLPYAGLMKSIRAGDYSYEEITSYSKTLFEVANSIEVQLPDQADLQLLEDLQISLLERSLKI